MYHAWLLYICFSQVIFVTWASLPSFFRHINYFVTKISVKGFLCFYFLNFIRIILHVVLLPLLFLNSASVLTKEFVGINDIAQFSPAFHPSCLDLYSLSWISRSEIRFSCHNGQNGIHLFDLKIVVVCPEFFVNLGNN